MLGNVTGEIKYITPGKDKSWREKHGGAVPKSSVDWLQGTLMVILGIDFKMSGWDAISIVRL